MNKEVILTVGISGSGKSTWTTEYIKNNPNYLRINRDDIRKTLVGNLDGYYQRKDLNTIEHLVNNIQDTLSIYLIDNSYSIVVDNTNLKPAYLEEWISLCRGYSYLYYDFKFKLFDINPKEAKLRVANRDNFYTRADIYSEEIDESKVKYIDKQYLDYQNIKKHIETNYKDKII